LIIVSEIERSAAHPPCRVSGNDDEEMGLEALPAKQSVTAPTWRSAVLVGSLRWSLSGPEVYLDLKSDSLYVLLIQSHWNVLTSAGQHKCCPTTKSSHERCSCVSWYHSGQL